MDRARNTEWVLNVRLARLLGLVQLLDVDCGGGGSRRAGRAAVACSCACLLAAAVMAPASLYQLAGDATAFTFYAGCSGNFAFACYKVAVVAANWRRVRRCVDVAACAYMRARPARYAAATFARWRGRSVRATYAYAAMIAGVLLMWAATPRAFPGVAWTVRRVDGTRAAYRLSVYNAYPTVAEATYNAYYEAFYAAELAVLVCLLYNTVLFDVLVISLCLALTCQLDAVCEAVRSLGYEDTSSTQLLPSDTDEKKQIQNETKSRKKINVINDLKTIIEDQQSVMNKLEDYNNIFRSLMIFQIFVASSSHIVIWFVVTMNILKVDSDSDTTLFTIKIFSALPMFTAQLLVTCYLFETINEKKDELIFSLYSSNWTEMDLKSKKLILNVMQVNNANQLKLKVTRTKIVNLEMFSQTMRLCYSIFSMMVNYKRRH